MQSSAFRATSSAAEIEKSIVTTYRKRIWNPFIEALKEYAEVYGPLTVDTVSENSDCWNWINEPWPWQEGGC